MLGDILLHHPQPIVLVREVAGVVGIVYMVAQADASFISACSVKGEFQSGVCLLEPGKPDAFPPSLASARFRR